MSASTPTQQSEIWSAYRRLPRQANGGLLQAMRPCPISASEETLELFTMPDFQFYTDTGGLNRIDFRLVFSQVSGLIYANPCYTPYGFQTLFGEAGQSYVNHRYSGRDTIRLDFLRSAASSRAHVLDVGCGTGGWLKSMPDAWTKVGIDVDGPSIEKARTQAPHIRFEQTEFENTALDETFDVITILQVLEHLPDPVYTLINLQSMAHDKTVLMVEVPDTEQFSENNYRDIVGVPSVLHLTHFTPATLRLTLQAAGWKVVSEMKVAPFYSYAVLAVPCKPALHLPDSKSIERECQIAQQVFARWQESARGINYRIEQSISAERILVWGAGLHTEYLAHFTPLFQPQRQFILIDSDPAKRDKTWHGISIVHPDEIPDKTWQDTESQVLISSRSAETQILQSLLARNIESHRIITLYQDEHA